MLSDKFTVIFRDEHRAIRDTLFNLIDAFQKRDKGRIHPLLEQVSVLAGPHFRYEEEVLYPALVDIFGQDYIEQLLGAHDRAIGAADRLIKLAGKDSLGDEDVQEAVGLVRGILPHVSDCDGLSIMVERLPEGKIQSVLDARDRSKKEGLDLVQWTKQVRGRPPVSIT